ncbi:hypothetical protein FBEOM_2796 [Fusarium beomiforme]|uniref:Uncharacterized protein n=1 Tax=Fusarium beomiforme TaxID=44412 RepID=A0A9P5AQT0_9HYPO|nr:hypothetical protein FBEOM_2796 [Fusarium beomiforme]
MMAQTDQEEMEAIYDQNAYNIEPLIGPNASLDFDGNLDMHAMPPSTEEDDVFSLQVGPLLQAPIPYKELHPRRKVVWVWVCCTCGKGASLWRRRNEENAANPAPEKKKTTIPELRANFKPGNGGHTHETAAFIIHDPTSHRWKDRIVPVETYCDGEEFVLSNFIPDIPDST